MPDLTPADSTSLLTTEPSLDYEAALERVMSLADFERSTHSPNHAAFHLERIGLLAERLGNPHLGIPTVHVAGTKGKGSTVAMITSILAAQGYRVGLFTSPHLHSATERIRVGLAPISRRDFAAVVEQIWPAVERVSAEGGYGGVTTFEMLTAMAFVYFKLINADFQVLEVGLGGRLDSTNIVTPEVCAITSISLDHTATLGDTIEKIAYEKAGIIKRGVPVAVAPQTSEAMNVFERVAAEREARLIRVGEDVTWQEGHADLEGQSFKLFGLRDDYDVRIPLLGDYQRENAGTAVAAIEALVEKGFNVSNESILRGLNDVRWSARLEVLSHEDKRLVVDGAHNPYSMRHLVQAVGQYFEFKRVILIFGALGGHSFTEMLDELAELSPTIIAVQSREPRATPGSIISEAASERGLSVAFESDNVGEATRRALEIATEDDLVLGTGSLSVAAEIIEEMKGIPPELYPYFKRLQNPTTPRV